MGKLRGVTTFGYDFFFASSSTVGNTLAPAIRLFVDLGGDLFRTNDLGLVIYEPIYTRQATNVSTVIATDVWNTDTSTQTTDQFWIRFGGMNQFQNTGKTLAQLTDPNTTGLIDPLNNGNAVVFGFNAGVVSG
ncbi:MAG: hypothetical protein C4320_02370 [Armatimonadota bacterium]